MFSYRDLIMLMFMALFVTGCGSARRPTEQVIIVTPTMPQVVVIDARDQTATPVTNTPSPTSTSAYQSNDGSSSPIYVPPNCVPRTDWPLYTVVSGDTLGSIARRINSTVSVLATANCLADANNIRVGGGLRVPTLPLTTVPCINTPTPRLWIGGQGRAIVTSLGIYPRPAAAESERVGAVPNGGIFTVNGAATCVNGAYWWGITYNNITGYTPETSNGAYVVESVTGSPVFAGGVQISPYVSLSGNDYVLQAGALVTLSWPEAPRNMQRIEFVMGTGSNTTIIGVDSNSSDGATATWTVPNNLGRMNVYAQATSTPGGHTAVDVYVRSSNTVPPRGNVVASPYVSFDHATYSLQANTNVTLSWPEAPRDALSVSFFTMPGTGAGNETLIGTDNVPSDGASIPLVVPANLNVMVRASAALAGGQTTSTAISMYMISGSVPVDNGQVFAYPYMSGNTSGVVLMANSSVNLTWPEAPLNAGAVEFFLTANGSTSSLGADAVVSDGAGIYIPTVAVGFEGTLTARAYFNDGTTRDTARGLPVRTQAASAGE